VENNKNTYTMGMHFDNALLSDDPIGTFVTPITPYFLCDHYISTEIYDHVPKYIGISLQLNSNDLLKNKNYNDIKEGDIIQIQVDLLDFFYVKITPILYTRKIKVIIFTSQWHLPQVTLSSKTDLLLNHENILLWISQNPIYKNHPKYMAFPYGICHHNVIHYVYFIKQNQINDKNIMILNHYSSVHGHLPSDHIRKKYDLFGKNSGNLTNYDEFLNNLLHSKFVISTTGDRDDCYRHYECIGLNAIPISNIDPFYKDIFGENMVYSHAEEMVSMVDTQTIDYPYSSPDKDLLTIEYWKCKIQERKNRIKRASHKSVNDRFSLYFT